MSWRRRVTASRDERVFPVLRYPRLAGSHEASSSSQFNCLVRNLALVHTVCVHGDIRGYNVVFNDAIECGCIIDDSAGGRDGGEAVDEKSPVQQCKRAALIDFDMSGPERSVYKHKLALVSDGVRFFEERQPQPQPQPKPQTNITPTPEMAAGEVMAKQHDFMAVAGLMGLYAAVDPAFEGRWSALAQYVLVGQSAWAMDDDPFSVELKEPLQTVTTGTGTPPRGGGRISNEVQAQPAASQPLIPIAAGSHRRRLGTE